MGRGLDAKTATQYTPPSTRLWNGHPFWSGRASSLTANVHDSFDRDAD